MVMVMGRGIPWVARLSGMMLNELSPQRTPPDSHEWHGKKMPGTKVNYMHSPGIPVRYYIYFCYIFVVLCLVALFIEFFEFLFSFFL